MKGSSGGKRWKEAQVHRPDENKWTAFWWKEQRRRRQTCLNQSFISFPPYAVQWLGSEWQVKLKPLCPPPVLTRTHIHLRYQTGFCLLCSGSWGKRPRMARKQEKHKPSFTDGDAISTGAVGGYQGDSSTSTPSRWPAWHCHSSPKTCMCHTPLRV